MIDTVNSSEPSRAIRPSHIEPVTLGQLVAGQNLMVPEGTKDLLVNDICLDSREVISGTLYVGLPGMHTHGASFAMQAQKLGAVALLTDEKGAKIASEVDIPVIISENPRKIMARFAAKIFGEPTQSLRVIGITGTNGKTTTAFLVESALQAAGRKVGTIGTIGFRLNGEALDSSRSTITTPESCDLQALFAVMKERGADTVVMEVSSHALALDRVEAVHFDVAAFTNLGRDHLDFHKTQDAYFEAKARLFRPEMSQRAVINGEDPWGKILVKRARSANAPQVVTTGFNEGQDYRVISAVPNDIGGQSVEINHRGRVTAIDIALPGRYNAANTATAVAILEQADIDLDKTLPGLKTAHVPGRMQRVNLGKNAPKVYVDFAHTPQAIESALVALPGRVVAVVGAGGDRDEAKRTPMGQAAALHADVVVVTDDNPRTEDPAAIRAEVLAGARLVDGVEIIDGSDRRNAIAVALAKAGPHDCVAVLGKGHEVTQEINGHLYPFNDVEVIQEEWAGLINDK